MCVARSVKCKRDEINAIEDCLPDNDWISHYFGEPDEFNSCPNNFGGSNCPRNSTLVINLFSALINELTAAC